MNQTTFTIQHGNEFRTVKTMAGAVGSVLNMFPGLRNGKVSWKTVGKVTVVNGEYIVTEISL